MSTPRELVVAYGVCSPTDAPRLITSDPSNDSTSTLQHVKPILSSQPHNSANLNLESARQLAAPSIHTVDVGSHLALNSCQESGGQASQTSTPLPSSQQLTSTAQWVHLETGSPHLRTVPSELGVGFTGVQPLTYATYYNTVPSGTDNAPSILSMVSIFAVLFMAAAVASAIRRAAIHSMRNQEIDRGFENVSLQLATIQQQRKRYRRNRLISLGLALTDFMSASAQVETIGHFHRVALPLQDACRILRDLLDENDNSKLRSLYETLSLRVNQLALSGYSIDSRSREYQASQGLQNTRESVDKFLAAELWDDVVGESKRLRELLPRT